MADDNVQDKVETEDDEYETFSKATMFEKLDIFKPKLQVDQEEPQDIVIAQDQDGDTAVQLHYNVLTLKITKLQESVSFYKDRYKEYIQRIKIAFLIALIVTHFGLSTYHFVTVKYPDWEWDKGYGLYLSLMILALIFIFTKYVLKNAIGRLGNDFRLKLKLRVLDCKICIAKKKWISWVIYLAILACIIVFLIIDSRTEPERLIAILGYCCIVMITLIFSRNVGLVKPRIVFCGIFMQFLMALLTVKIKLGREIFRIIGDRITLFLNYTGIGARYVFGDPLTYDGFTFAFRGLSTVYFLAACVSYLYYYNILQRIVFCLGSLLSILLDTTIVESVNAAANIFFGITESPLLLKPYLLYLTSSEIHAIAASGFGSVAGTVMGLYISFGARADHMIIASVINPFTSLFFAKILYPEDEESQTTQANIKMPESDDLNALDAVSQGAMNSVQLVLGIVSNVMTFITIVVIINQMTEWIGERIGTEGLSVEMLLSYAFMPLSFLFGVKWSECYHVGSLIATKSIINELVAYMKLGQLRADGKLSKRSVAISTFAIFGFSNPGTIGIIISAFYYLEPTQVHNVIRSILSSFVCGTLTCFSTACLIGMLLKDEDMADM